MKHIIILLFCMLISFTISAQKQEFNPPYFVNGIRLDSLEGPYIHVWTVDHKLLNRDVKLRIDYGQDNTDSGGASFLRTLNDSKVIFRSPVDIKNFMYKNGWEYIDNNIMVSNGNSTTSYTFKKKS